MWQDKNTQSAPLVILKLHWFFIPATCFILKLTYRWVKCSHNTCFFRLVIADLIYILRLYSNYFYFKLLEISRLNFFSNEIKSKRCQKYWSKIWYLFLTGLFNSPWNKDCCSFIKSKLMTWWVYHWYILSKVGHNYFKSMLQVVFITYTSLLPNRCCDVLKLFYKLENILKKYVCCQY